MLESLFYPVNMAGKTSKEGSALQWGNQWDKFMRKYKPPPVKTFDVEKCSSHRGSESPIHGGAEFFDVVYRAKNKKSLALHLLFSYYCTSSLLGISRKKRRTPPSFQTV